jgi:hypothetical protein
MAKLRINGDSSGYVDLEAPNAASSSTLDLDQVPQKNVANTFTANNTFSSNSYFGSEGVRLSTDGSGELGVGYGQTATTKRFSVYNGTSNRFSISPEGYVTTPNQPSFYARLHASFSSTTTGAEIVPPSSFSSQWNTGSGFSGNRFTAPVAGKYMFIFSAEKANNYTSVSVALSIFKNGSEFPNARLYDSNQNTRKTIQYTMIMDMAVNDYAEPFIYSYQTGSVYDNRGQFAGFLIG